MFKSSSGFFIVLNGVGVGVGVGFCNEMSALVFDTGILLFIQPERKMDDMNRDKMVSFLIGIYCSKIAYARIDLMSMPIWVGLVLVIIALTVFSGWFLNLAGGLRELVLDDQLFGVRIAMASVLSFLLFIGSFWVIAMVNECKSLSPEGIFANLNCEEYSKLSTGLEGLFNKADQESNQPL